MLHEVQHTLEPRAAALGLWICIEVEQADDFIIADESRPRQVLVNVAGNAINYTSAGRVTIRVTINAGGATFSVHLAKLHLPRRPAWSTMKQRVPHQPAEQDQRTDNERADEQGA